MTIVFISFYIMGLWSLCDQNAYEINCFIEFWKRSFNFTGITKRRNFWITQAWYLLHVILLVMFGICLFIDFNMSSNNSSVNWSEVGPFILIPIYAFSIVSYPQYFSSSAAFERCRQKSFMDAYEFCSVYWINCFINFLSESLKKKDYL